MTVHLPSIFRAAEAVHHGRDAHARRGIPYRVWVGLFGTAVVGTDGRSALRINGLEPERLFGGVDTDGTRRPGKDWKRIVRAQAGSRVERECVREKLHHRRISTGSAGEILVGALERISAGLDDGRHRMT